ncbi:USO1 (YDL058W) [Zygosaccharomyces parabailii]|nr:USO1 (YDL058W) [Zygosaccharomyces parabailii]CDH10953.1 related to Intracellular protein transport protein USO1 [Zygosaccharomyces bailii ISA1307]
MELIQGFIQPPKIQSAEETIPTLCDRVENATLINDRRSAVLGLKAFSREYRESVVASGLKPLINTLKRDFVDENSVKAILETLLILFIRGDGDDDLTRNWISQQSRLQNGKYPSPLVMKQEKQQADQFSLWIADAITQSDELVHLLIELLETGNFHIRLYTIQLLEAVVSARPTRSRSAIISLPTGVSTLVSLLDDVHEPIRDEAILLLMSVVNESSHVQVLVAFENIFERLFCIIEEEGGLRGSIVVNDCLSLIHNILKYNTSNQTLFLESGNLPRLAQILNEPLAGEEFFWNEQRVININTALDIVSLTVDPGNSTAYKNQTMLLESSVLMIVLRLAFHHNIPKNVRPVALLSAADMIRGNSLAQKEFGKIDVPYFDPSLPSPVPQIHLVPIVKLLLNWTFYTNSVHLFSLRVASLELLKSYLHGDGEIQISFLSQEIKDYSGKELASIKCNLFEAILDYDLELKLNPYKLFFAADLFMYLFEADTSENDGLREMTRKVTTGSGLDEEEKLSSIQSLSELIITSLTSEDIRIPISYITLLIFWIYGDQNALNDFLSNKGVIQSLLSFSYQVESDDITVKCLVTMLLGVSYEFCSKNSPFPRKQYFEYITKTLGKDNYFSRISQFKNDSMFAKAPKEIGLNPAFDETGLPRVYFSPYFVTFFTENYYRIKTALLHSCEEEPYAKISYETFEELQNECHMLKQDLKQIESDNSASVLELSEKLNTLTEEHESLAKSHDDLQQNSAKIKMQLSKTKQQLKETEALLKETTDDKDKLLSENSENLEALENFNQMNDKNKESIQSLENKLKSVTAAKNKAEEGINKMNRELMALTRSKGELESKMKELQKKNEKLSSDFKKKEKSLESLIMQKDKYMDSLKLELDKSQEKISILNFQNNALINDSNEWKSKFYSNDKLISKMTEKLQSISENYNQLQIERDGLSNSLQELKLGSNNELSTLKNNFDSLSASKCQIATENEALVKDLATLQEKYDNFSGKYEYEKATLTSEIKNLTKAVSELEKSLEETKVEKEETTKEVGRLQIKCDNCEENFEAEKSAKEILEQRFGDLKQNLNTCRIQLDETIKKNTELDTASHLHISEAEKLKEELIIKIEALDTASKLSKELEGELKRKEESYIESEKNMKSALIQLEEAKANALADNESLRIQLQQIENEYEELKSQNTTNVEELKKCISDLREERERDEKKLKELDEQLKEKANLLEGLKEKRKKDSELIGSLREQLGSFSCEKDELLTTKSELEKQLDASKEKLESSVQDVETSRKEYEELKKAEEKALEEVKELRKNFKLEAEGNKREFEKLKQAKMKADAQLQKMEKISQEKQSEIEALKVAKKKASSELAKLQRSLQETDKEMTNLRIEFKKKVQDFEKERKLLNEGSDSVTRQYSEEITKLEEKLQKTESELQSKGKELDNSKAAEKESRVDSEEALAEKASEITSLKSAIDELKSKAKEATLDLERQATDSEKKITELGKTIGTLKMDITQKNNRIVANDNKLREYTERCKTLQNELNDINLKFKNQSIKYEKLENKESSLQEILTKANEEKNICRKKLEEKNLQYDELEERLNIKSSELDDLESQRKARQRLEETVQRYEREIVDLESKVAELDGLRKQLESNLNELKNLEVEGDCRKSELKMIITEKDEILGNLEKKSKKVEDLEKELAKKCTELETLSADKIAIVENLEKLLKERELSLVTLEAEKSNLVDSKIKLESLLEGNNAKLANENFTNTENEKLRIRVEKLGEDLSSLQAKASQYEEEKSSLNQEKNSLSVKADSLAKELRNLVSSNEQSKIDSDARELQTKEENKRLSSELEKLRLELAESSKTKGNDKSPKSSEGNSEVDELMLLVTDLDEKNTKYKAKLKELGVELSSDEDDEDEDEDEDDEKAS